MPITTLAGSTPEGTKGNQDNTPVTICQVRVSPRNSVRPNIGATELAETLARILPFASRHASFGLFYYIA